MDDDEQIRFARLFRGSLIPLHACLTGLTWIIHDYVITLEDEIRYIWPQKGGFGKYMFLWIRYYSIALLLFDVTQIHLFSRPGITNDTVCVAMDSVIRIVGAVSLWSVEIIMQLRVYALYKCSKKVAVFNAVLFVASIGAFLWILIHNAMKRHDVIKDAIHLPLPGCPTIHSGIEWAQWVPATAFEGVLFLFALHKSAKTVWYCYNDKGLSIHSRMGTLYELLLRDNIMYFFGISCLLVFNNLMVVGVTRIPWFSYSPFHAAMGILTTRMLLNLRKATVPTTFASTDGSTTLGSGRIAHKPNPPTATESHELNTWHAASVPPNRSLGDISSFGAFSQDNSRAFGESQSLARHPDAELPPASGKDVETGYSAAR